MKKTVMILILFSLVGCSGGTIGKEEVVANQKNLIVNEVEEKIERKIDNQSLIEIDSIELIDEKWTNYNRGLFKKNRKTFTNNYKIYITIDDSIGTKKDIEDDVKIQEILEDITQKSYLSKTSDREDNLSYKYVISEVEAQIGEDVLISTTEEIIKNGEEFNPKEELSEMRRKIAENRKYDVRVKIGTTYHPLSYVTKAEVRTIYSERLTKQRKRSRARNSSIRGTTKSKYYHKPFDWHEDVIVIKTYE